MGRKNNFFIQIAVISCLFLFFGQSYLTEVYNDGRINIYSYDNGRLKGDPNGVVSVTSAKGDWEKWKLIPKDDSGDKFYIQSWHGTYLVGRPNRSLGLTTAQGDWEVWTKIQLGGFVYFQSYHKTFLGGKTNQNAYLTLEPQKSEQWVPSDTLTTLQWFYGGQLSAPTQQTVSIVPYNDALEKWILINVADNKFYIKSWLRKLYLKGSPDGQVSLTPVRDIWETWTIIEGNENFKFSQIKSYHGTNLGANEKGEVFLVPYANNAEQWFFEDRVATMVSTFGTRLKADPNLSVELTTANVLWQKWRFFPIGDNIYYIKSYHDLYLQANTDGTVVQFDYIGNWGKWQKIVDGEHVIWKSFHGNYLAATSNNNVALANQITAASKWTFGDA